MQNKLTKFTASNRILISRILFFVVLFFLLFSSHQLINPWTNYVLEALGLIFIVIGVFGRLWAGIYIYGYKNDKIVQKGPYSIVRNPLYFFSFWGALGVSISSKNIIVFTLIMGFFIIYYPWVVIAEENKLAKKFPDDYRQYKKRVPRFIPKFSLYKSAEKYEVNVYKFRKIFLDLMWFFWLYLILRLITILHQLNILPVLIELS